MISDNFEFDLKTLTTVNVIHEQTLITHYVLKTLIFYSFTHFVTHKLAVCVTDLSCKISFIHSLKCIVPILISSTILLQKISNQFICIHFFQCDDDPPHAFTQTFLLKPLGASFFVQHDIFRLAIHDTA